MNHVTGLRLLLVFLVLTWVARLPWAILSSSPPLSTTPKSEEWKYFLPMLSLSSLVDDDASSPFLRPTVGDKESNKRANLPLEPSHQANRQSSDVAMTSSAVQSRNISQIIQDSSYNEGNIQSMVNRMLELAKTWTTKERQSSPHDRSEQQHQQQKRCALLFHGLPRSFETIVLPSIVRHVLIPNARHRCDVFAFVHKKYHEPKGRSGKGGAVNPNSIYLLETAVYQVANKTSTMEELQVPFDRNQAVIIESFTDGDLQRERGAFMNTTRSVVNDKTGTSLYLDCGVVKFNAESAFNIVRMWHGIEGVWNLMKRHTVSAAAAAKEPSPAGYDRVGIFRCDVFYATPIDIFRVPPGYNPNQVAVIPGFANFPVNDRLLYGPYDAVEIYATQRFHLIHRHVQTVQREKTRGMHPEKFLGRTLFPAIQQQTNISIVEDLDICFVRARADESLWINDCDLYNPKSKNHRPRSIHHEANVLQQAQQIFNRTCTRHVLNIPNMVKMMQAKC